MKEIGRKRINWDSIVTVELSLKELQLIRDAMVATDLKDMTHFQNPQLVILHVCIM